MEIPDQQPVKLDLGAGSKHNPGYIRVGLEEQHDVVTDLRKLPFPDDYADEAMAIHVIEHFYLWDVPGVLAEWLRVLKPGGLLVLELPDLVKCARNYAANPNDERHGILGMFGDSRHGDVLMLHKWGYSPASLTALLREAGFGKVKEKPTQFHGRRGHRDMRLECRKPIE